MDRAERLATWCEETILSRGALPMSCIAMNKSEARNPYCSQGVSRKSETNSKFEFKNLQNSKDISEIPFFVSII